MILKWMVPLSYGNKSKIYYYTNTKPIEIIDR